MFPEALPSSSFRNPPAGLAPQEPASLSPCRAPAHSVTVSSLVLLSSLRSASHGAYIAVTVGSVGRSAGRGSQSPHLIPCFSFHLDPLVPYL